MSILIPILVVLHVMVCLLMVLVVLMQRPRSEGLGAAFGGGMTENLFGAQTTHVLQKFTVWLGIGFFGITLLLAILFSRSSVGTTTIQRELLAEPGGPVEVESAPATVPETDVVVEESPVTDNP
jgi:protein translocase SecG subunit